MRIAVPRYLVPLALAALLVAGCTPEDAGPLGPTRTVERQAIERLVVATGTIEPEKEVEVRPRISGIVERIHVEAGDLVKEGEALIEIDRELFEVQAEEARARLQEAEVEKRYAKTALDRVSELHRGGSIADQDREDALARYERATAAVARSKANLRALEVRLRYSTVSAPSAGKVLDLFVEEGSAVAAVTSVTGGSPLLSLAAADTLHLKGLVDENEIARVEVGQPARIHTEAFGERVFQGEVREISPLGVRRQNVTYFEVEILVTDPDGALLRPRMSADADIVAEVIPNALVVPETALIYDGNGIFVEALLAAEGDARTERRPVEVGVVQGDRVEIVDGLEEGAQVVLQ